MYTNKILSALAAIILVQCFRRRCVQLPYKEVESLRPANHLQNLANIEEDDATESSKNSALMNETDASRVSINTAQVANTQTDFAWE